MAQQQQQRSIDIRRSEQQQLNPFQAIWWEPLFSAQREANQAARQAFSEIGPAGRLWKMQDEMLASTQNQLHRFFGEIFNNRQMTMPWLMGEQTEPYVDITENGDVFRVRAELPGVNEEDIEISAIEGGLAIRGEKAESAEERDEQTLHRECHYGAFSRTIALPEEADLDKADASFEKNVLTIEIPKKPGAKQGPRPVNIRSGTAGGTRKEKAQQQQQKAA